MQQADFHWITMCYISEKRNAQNLLLFVSSMQNPVLRSASFHGTAGLTPKYISSEEEEEELTLSADESSPMFGQPPLPAAPLSPSKVLNVVRLVLEEQTIFHRTELYNFVLFLYNAASCI
jgi:hypothetical protein